ncbi:MAG: TolC family protein [Ferruginibacter sp.]
MKKVWLNSYSIIALLLLSLTVTAQQVNNFSVKQAADYGTKNAIQVKNALLDVKIQQQTNKEITASAYPQLNGSISVNDYLDIPTSLVPGEFAGQPPGTFIPLKFGTKYNATGGLDLQQLLFDGQVFVGLQARATSIQYSQKAVEVTQEQIKGNIYKIYYQLVVGKKQLETIDANIDKLEKLLHDVTELFKNGFAERLDIDKTNVQLNNLRTEKAKIENTIANGNSGLKFLIGMPQKEMLVLTDTLSDEELKANSLDDKAITYEDRKQYQMLSLAKKLGEYNIKRYKLTYLPTVSAFANYNKNAQRTKFDFFGDGDWFTTSLIGLKINIPIFDGFAKKARIERARLQLQQTNNNIELLKQSIDNDVEQARKNMVSAMLTMDNQKKNIELSDKVYRTTKLKYEQGLTSTLDIYNANADLRIAQNNYYSALYDAINAKIDYLKAVGRL